MEIGKYLTRERTLVLSAQSKDDVLREMVGVLCEEDDSLDFDTVLKALIRREKILSSRIAPRIALPHALLPGYGKPLVVLGCSPDGIPWESPGGERVSLVIMSVCGRDYGNEHVTMMTDIAHTLRNPAVLERIERSETADQIYDILQGPVDAPDQPLDPHALELCRSMLKHADSMVSQGRARSVLLVADRAVSQALLQERSGKGPLIIASNENRSLLRDERVDAHLLRVPGYGFAREDRVKMALLSALSEGLLGSHDSVVCLSGETGSGSFNVLEVLDISREFDVLLSFRSEVETGDTGHHVFHRVLQIASTLAHEGREGKPVGALFIIGDYPNVQQRCYQMVINPFRGYPENERNILDPALEETVKEFSRVDGACLIRGDGVVMAMGAYIQAEDAARALQSGLGARHAAGMAITMSTQAISVVISESTRRISIFQHGRLIISLDRA